MRRKSTVSKELWEPNGMASQEHARQTFGNRSGFIVVDRLGRHVFVPEKVYGVRRLLLSGVDEAELPAKTGLSPAQLHHILETIERFGLLEEGEARFFLFRFLNRLRGRRSPARVRVVILLMILAGVLGGVAWLTALPTTLTGSQRLGRPLGERSTLMAWTWICGLILHFIVHESGHVLTALRLGAKVGGIRIRRLGPWFTLVSNVSGVWALSRVERVLVSIGGPAASLAFAATNTALAWALEGHDLSSSFAALAATGYLAAMVSLNPLFKLDGYFALSHALDLPNLQFRALMNVKRLFERRDDESARRKRPRSPALAVYGLLSIAAYVSGTVVTTYWIIGRVKEGRPLDTVVPTMGLLLLIWSLYKSYRQYWANREKPTDAPTRQ